MIGRKILQVVAEEESSIGAIPDTSFSPFSAAAVAGKPFSPSIPFDTSMALTILILVTAFFFLIFFSFYIRHSETATDTTSATASRRLAPPSRNKGGLDPSAIGSLPLVAYGKAAKHPMIVDDCPICLSEFNERETVKLIPYCSHVFHPSCIDTWLASHVTCPLCRSCQLFKSVEEVCLGVARDEIRIGASEIGERSTAEDDGAWRHEAAARVRRSCSFPNLVNQQMLQRSTSF
ncbi:hypothetical protein DH2020_000321 [Rehmannia glutinosa]|uniref:RING-type E3 ubiquitin transferase n=1 Tax=Rehmannia glutinosa TaxID=99300 RepID=A0ABR0XWB7_REHGL